MRTIINWVKHIFYRPSPMRDESPIPDSQPKPIEPTIPEPLTPEPGGKFSGHFLNQAGIDLIKKWEGLYLRPYLDPAIPPVPTIGYGTIAYPNGVKVRMTDPFITEKQAVEFMLFELKDKVEIIDKHLRSIDFPLNSNQFSALISLSYNLGWGVITQPNRTMGSAILKKDFALIHEAFSVYNKAGGRRLNGLVNRRKDEQNLFNKIEVRNV